MVVVAPWLWVLVAMICGCGFVMAVGCRLRLWWSGVGCRHVVVVVGCCWRGVVGECGNKNKENELLNCGKQIMKK